ncbi:MAG: acyl-CoA dehydratase activase [Candidatus Thorarchaeota archaeon]|nr:MAG: 2-hydroxyglutaryl-CoA dehydratase [Candidatus Thorarchaeota archaeon]RLI59326.1 MAG: 2-hydroxyglutaryl-CoA dehydratase [Candidatus Thorarchaeota archaeon]
MRLVEDLGIGIDVGSTTTKGVLLRNGGAVLASALVPTGRSASDAVDRVLEEIRRSHGHDLGGTPMISTGYGRKQVELSNKSVTEITCHSIGVHTLNPDIKTLIDVGGQDSKVIRIGSNGRPEDFELNDKCSAGTGRFLEVMARVLEVSIDELGPLALQSTSPCSISSTCTVFAESEVIGHIGSGMTPADIAAGIHISMASKITSLARRVGVLEPVCVTGGVALNPAFRKFLSQNLTVPLWISETPQLTGAIGAAILALRQETQTSQ